jgi:ABC-type sugar transport system permease subunit
MNDLSKGSANAMILLLILIVFLVLYIGIFMRRAEEE